MSVVDLSQYTQCTALLFALQCKATVRVIINLHRSKKMRFTKVRMAISATLHSPNLYCAASFIPLQRDAEITPPMIFHNRAIECYEIPIMHCLQSLVSQSRYTGICSRMVEDPRAGRSPKKVEPFSSY
jgi:hypothetical protein